MTWSGGGDLAEPIPRRRDRCRAELPFERTTTMSDRRRFVPFDPHFFERQEREGRRLTLRETFRHIFRTGHWRSEELSGTGASLSQTAAIAQELPGLLHELGVDVMLDLPCGDFAWMRHLHLPVSKYIGADIVPELVDANQQRYGDERRSFMVLDLTADPLPPAELLFCRDCLVHLSFEDIGKALGNIRRSGIIYLLTTTFPDCAENEDITTGDWRLINLERPPFSFPAPLRLIDEQCTEGSGRYRDKSLGLWRVSDLPVPGPDLTGGA